MSMMRSVKRRSQPGAAESRTSEVWVRGIGVRYHDGRSIRFVPELPEEFLSRDDVERVVGMMRGASNVLEWGLAPEREPGAVSDERGAV